MCILSQTAIVIIEIARNDAPPEIQYITMGIVGRISSEEEIANDALNYLNTTTGIKTVKQVIIANNEQYRAFLANNIQDFANNQ